MTLRGILLGFLTSGILLYSSLTQSQDSPPSFYCNLWEDAQGISHIQAQSDLNAYACFGYIHGRDRAWEIDFLRRTVQGRKAELLGSKEIRSDFFMRLLQLPKKAAQIFNELPKTQQELLRSYSEGINQGFLVAIRNGVYELRKWNESPDPWTPIDSISLILLQSFDQTKRAFLTEFDETKNLSRHGEKAVPLFIRDEMPWDQSILKKGEYPTKNPSTKTKTEPEIKEAFASHAQTIVASVKSFLEELPDLVPPSGIGSNNWVIAPSMSKSGHAWLANDPHLELRHPSLWHWTHVESPSLNVIGAALPGVPLIVSGANRKLAWGLTNSYLDVADLSLIPSAQLQVTDQERPLIWFKFGMLKLPFFFKKTFHTVYHRPILPLDGPEGKSIVLNWTGFDLKGSDFSGFFELMNSTQANEADQALSRIGVPSWNFVFADTQGNIGYRAIGRVPRKETQKSYGITELSLDSFRQSIQTQEILSVDEMPHVINPSRGWIATANSRQWPSNSKYSPGRAHAQGFRQFRIEELLMQNRPHDLNSLSRTQCDIQAVDARFILPLLLKTISITPELSHAADLLKKWDFETTLKCEACALYRRWMDRIRVDSGLNLPAIYRVLHASENELYTPLKTIIQNALSLAQSELRNDKPSSARPEFPRWGEVHTCLFPHLGDREFFNDPGIPTPGDEESVNPGNSEWNQGHFRQTSGASQRLIVELSDPPVIYSILPGSIQDIEKRDFEKSDSPWRKWVACEYEKRIFPVDWSQVKLQKISW